LTISTIEVKDNKIIIEPQVMVPNTRHISYTPQWAEGRTAATQDIKKGKTTKTANLKELFKELDKI